MKRKLISAMNQITDITAASKILEQMERLCRGLLILFVLLTAIENLTAQVTSAATACRLLGADTVTAGSTASFTLSPCSATGWTTSCGAVVAQSSGSVTVNFSSNTCGTAVVAAIGGATAGSSKTVTILQAPAFSAGTPSTITQAIAFNKAPNMLKAAEASGGLCQGVFSYQWFSSTDNTNFLPITGATGQNYQPGPLTTTTYFKRQANCAVSGNATTTTMTVTVAPYLAGSILNPPVQTVNYDSTPTALSVSVPATAVGTSYQWQSASNASFIGAAAITGANNNRYAPGNLTSTTYYRAIMILHGDSVYSSPSVVAVFPALNGGTLSPATQTVAYDSLPGLMTCSAYSGGTGEYSFFWYSSADGNTWNPVPGVTSAGYNPGILTATTWFRVLVTSNGVAVASANAVINVTSQQ